MQQVNLSGADLSGAILNGADLTNANLRGANLTEATLVGASLINAHLSFSDLIGSDFSRANLLGADLRYANLTSAKLYRTGLCEVNLTGANLKEADLTSANLRGAVLVETRISEAKLTNCDIYGLSAWNLKGVPNEQSNLVITTMGEAVVTVDDLQVAQFIHFLLNNQNVRNIIDTITSKVVLILGRFSIERKPVLDALRVHLGKLNYAPIIFDFTKPLGKDMTGTVETLARMARFIIADLSDSSSIPHELAMIVPFLRTTPILPLQVKGTAQYSMFSDFQRAYPWVLQTHEYKDEPSLIAALAEIIAPANEMAEVFRRKE